MLVIDPTSTVRPFEQLRQQLIAQINSGVLVPGTRLPTVRRLASDLGLAPNTVARAYRELEAAGFVRTAGRNGTVVALPNDGPDIAQRASMHADTFVLAMRGLGLGPDAMIAYVRRSLAELAPG